MPTVALGGEATSAAIWSKPRSATRKQCFFRPMSGTKHKTPLVRLTFGSDNAEPVALAAD
jgi:hypothetical protein